jgi:hypothetical protein
MSNLEDHEAEQDAITARYEAAAQVPKRLSKKELRFIVMHEHYHAIMHEHYHALLQVAAPKPRRVRTNFDRATEGLRLCDLMENMTGVDDLASQITDALCHLMHVCRLMRDEDSEVLCFEYALEMARMNFDAECDEDPDN